MVQLLAGYVSVFLTSSPIVLCYLLVFNYVLCLVMERSLDSIFWLSILATDVWGLLDYEDEWVQKWLGCGSGINRQCRQFKRSHMDISRYPPFFFTPWLPFTPLLYCLLAVAHTFGQFGHLRHAKNKWNSLKWAGFWSQYPIFIPSYLLRGKTRLIDEYSGSYFTPFLVGVDVYGQMLHLVVNSNQTSILNNLSAIDCRN